MPLKLGPAGVPLSCKGRTIVEGMDDITVLGLDAMEVQTVRTIQPQHFTNTGRLEYSLGNLTSR
tara:strand:- start:794 stop:985 length:192 start_codon:yes stop_codon:yes gene_type:complete